MRGALDPEVSELFATSFTSDTDKPNSGQYNKNAKLIRVTEEHNDETFNSIKSD